MIQNMMAIKEDQVKWFISFLIKSLVEMVLSMNQIMNQLMNFINQLLENLKKEKFIHFLETVFEVLIQLIRKSLSKNNKGNKYLLCPGDLLSKYVQVVPKNDEKRTSTVNAFQKIISKERKPSKIWVDQGSKFYNNSFKDFLKLNNIEMYSTYNEGKTVVAERFIRTLKKKDFQTHGSYFKKRLL